MHPVKGPRQPVSINPNGKLDYTVNPMEDLSVEECAPWEASIINALKIVPESVFSSQTLEGSPINLLKSHLE